MKYIEFLKNHIFSLILLLLISVFVILNGFSWLSNLIYYQLFITHFSAILGKASSFILDIIGFENSYNVMTDQIIAYNKQAVSIAPGIGMKFYFGVIMILLFSSYIGKRV